MSHTLSKLLVAGIFIGFSASAANADTAGQGKTNIGDFYVGVSAGIVIPDDVNTSLSGSIPGYAVSGSGKYTFNAGPSVNLDAGYHINDYLAVEAELGYAGFSYNSLSGTLTVGATTATGSIGIDGTVDTVSGIANAIVTPWGRAGFSGFVPYAGGGLGFANSSTKINSVTVNGATYSVNSSRSDTNLAADAIVGFDYAASDRFSIGGRYRFAWVNSGRSFSSGGLTETTGDSYSHTFVANLAYHF